MCWNTSARRWRPGGRSSVNPSSPPNSARRLFPGSPTSWPEPTWRRSSRNATPCCTCCSTPRPAPTTCEHPMNLDDLTAIDVHVHVEQDAHGHLALDGELMDASA